MRNSEKYYFAEFTFEEYRKLLRLAKENFIFTHYDSFDRKSRFVLWRHDLDYSIHKALRIAQIEAEEGISSTYFIHLHSEFYNFFEPENFSRIKNIINLGHRIGLHFDTHFYKIASEDQLDVHLRREREILSNCFDAAVEVFSFHNTTPFVLTCREWKYGGMINTYAAYFQEEVKYCSDSNGTWLHRKLSHVLADESINQLQVLTHPEWWDDKILSPKQKLWSCIDGRAEYCKNYCINGFRAFDREFIDW